MATQIIDFDIELAKKIASGEKEGEIKTKDGNDVKILTFNAHLSYGFCIVALYRKEDGDEAIETYRPDGSVLTSGAFCSKDLVIDVPIAQEKESVPFKPFDKVLVRDEDYLYWRADLFSDIRTDHNEIPYKFPYGCIGNSWKQCIHYEGNEHLLGTTNKPKEE